MSEDLGEYNWERLNLNSRTLQSLANDSTIDQLEKEWIETESMFDIVVVAFNDIFGGTGDSAKASLGAAVICARRSCNHRVSSNAIADELSCSSNSILHRAKRLTIPSQIPEVALSEIVEDIDEIDDNDYQQAKEELERIPPKNRSGHQDNVLAAVALYRAVNGVGEESAPQGRPKKDETRLSAKQIAEWFDITRPAVHTAQDRLPRN